jgi:hypothetical protein
MLRFAVTASTLLSAYAADLDDGQTECVKDGLICNFNEECVNADVENFERCIPKGNSVCNTYDTLGDDGDVIAVASCEPYQTCCGGQCCNAAQACAPNVAATNTFLYKDGNGTTSYSIGDIMRNEWKLPDGTELANRPMSCQQSAFLSANAGVKTIVIPLLGAVSLGFIGKTAFSANGGIMGYAKAAPEGVAILVTAFFLQFSPAWGYAMLSAILVGLSAVATTNQFWVTLVSFTVLLMYFGGGNIIVWNNPSQVTQNLVLISAEYDLANAALKCTTYYKYFYYSDLPYTKDPTLSPGWGYCSLEWYGFEILMAYFQLFALIALVTRFGMAYFSDGATAKVAPKVKVVKEEVPVPVPVPVASDDNA